MFFDLRRCVVRTVIAIATIVSWGATIWCASFATVGRPLGGEWSRVLVLGPLILAGIGTIVLAIAQLVNLVAQLWVPMARVLEVGIDIGEQSHAPATSVVDLTGHRTPQLRARRGRVTSPAGTP